MAYKLVNLIQSISRLKNVKITLLGNTIRLNDIILTKLGIDNMQPGEIRKIKDKYGLLIVAHYVSIEQYKQYTTEANGSIAGRFASILGEDNLEKNEFKSTLDNNLIIPHKQKQSHLLFSLHGEVGSVRINVTKDYSEYYVLNDYGKNKSQRYCVEQKYMSGVVKY